MTVEPAIHDIEGTEQMQRGLELDPLNPFFQALAGTQEILAGRSEEGIARTGRFPTPMS